MNILTYHSFLGSKNPYSFSLEELAEHCDSLKAAGYTFIGWKDFINGSYSGAKNVLVAIDDGHRTAYEAYQRVLRPRGIKPLLAVYPAVIGKKKFALTWEQLKSMLDDGCFAASHGFYHGYCNRAAMKKNYKSVVTEIVKSKEALEKSLGCAIDTFVYPFGSYSPDTISLVKQAGYARAMTVRSGPAAASEDYEIPRYILTRKEGSGLSALLGNRDEKRLAAKKASVGEITDKPESAYARQGIEKQKEQEAENKKRLQSSTLRGKILSLITGVYREKIKTVRELRKSLVKLGMLKYSTEKK